MCTVMYKQFDSAIKNEGCGDSKTHLDNFVNFTYKQ